MDDIQRGAFLLIYSASGMTKATELKGKNIHVDSTEGICGKKQKNSENKEIRLSCFICSFFLVTALLLDLLEVCDSEESINHTTIIIYMFSIM